MNKYKKTFSQKNKMRKTLKTNHMLKNKYKKLTKKRSAKLYKNLAVNNKRKKRYQIGCSRKKYNMNGGGLSPFQFFYDVNNNTEHMLNTSRAAVQGTTPDLSPNPTISANLIKI
jgi:hypothetical protein